MNANLLTDEIFGIERGDGSRARLSLPGLLAALGENAIESLTGLRRHQGDTFHIFLCYLAAAVLERDGTTEPVRTEGSWRAGLRRLSGRDDDRAWTLVVEDPAQPAFLQPPSPVGLAGYRLQASTPDALDVLQTAKNHDLKSARAIGGSPESWVFSLICMQTASGFLGRDNYGICRMNGGHGSRPCVEALPDPHLAARWRRGTRKLLDLGASLLPPNRPYRRDGHVLLWLVPWDGESSLALDELHPFFIEVCRRVRLVNRADRVAALGKPTRCSRIATAKKTQGDVGDPWTPLRRAGRSALTVSARGFAPDLLRDLIVAHQTYEPCPMQALEPGGGAAWFHASVLVRGQGTTDGYHEARVYIAPQAKRLLLAGGEGRERLAALSEWALTRARDVRAKALRPALFALLEGGPEGWPDTNRREMSAWIDVSLGRYDSHWNERYFPWLWDTLERSDASARRAWLEELRDRATTVLGQALRGSPQRSARRYRAKVRARGLFRAAFRRHFGEEMMNVAA